MSDPEGVCPEGVWQEYVSYLQGELRMAQIQRDETRHLLETATGVCEDWKRRVATLTAEAETNREERDAALEALEECRRLFREWRDGQWCPYGEIIRGFARALGESEDI